METVHNLLKLLTDAYPPEPRQHHAITLRDDKMGLVISLFQGEIVSDIRLDENDLKSSAESIFEAIKGLMEYR